MPFVEFDFYVARQSWSKVFRSRASAEKNPILDARVNIYTHASHVMDLGNMLSAEKLYLQRPLCPTPSKSYQNPHYVTFLGIEPRTLEEEHEAKAGPDIGDTTENVPEKELDKDDLKNEFAVVFGSLIRSHCLSELAADRRIKTNLTP
jgi:hypothetical protein